MESPSATYPVVPATGPWCTRPGPGAGAWGTSLDSRRRLPGGPLYRGRATTGPHPRGRQVDTALQHGAGPRYVHDALFFSSTDELAVGTVPFVREGLAAGDAVVVTASPAAVDVVHWAVDGDPRLHVLERHETYHRRTPAAVTGLRRLADRLTADGTRRVRVVGETDFGRTERDWLEWQRYEAVVNDALAAWPLWGLCVFDTTRLPDRVLDSVARTHPT